MAIATTDLQAELTVNMNAEFAAVAYSINGVTGTCSISPVAKTNDTTQDGMLTPFDAEATLSKADFTAANIPVPRNTGIFDGVKYYVEESLSSTYSVVLKLRRM